MSETWATTDVSTFLLPRSVFVVCYFPFIKSRRSIFRWSTTKPGKPQTWIAIHTLRQSHMSSRTVNSAIRSAKVIRGSVSTQSPLKKESVSSCTQPYLHVCMQDGHLMMLSRCGRGWVATTDDLHPTILWKHSVRRQAIHLSHCPSIYVSTEKNPSLPFLFLFSFLHHKTLCNFTASTDQILFPTSLRFLITSC